MKHSDKGDIVLESFMGSGSAAAACVHTGRNFIGMEKDAGYDETAMQRMEAEQP